MPTYEYECDKCKHKFEKFQTMSDDPLKKCPECGGKVHRLIGIGGGIIFKGKGFYHTDYKNKKRSSEGEKPSCPNAGADTCKGCPQNKKKDD